MKKSERRITGGAVRRDVATTFFTQIVVLIAGLYSYRLAKTLFSSEVFASYALIKRNVALLLPLFLTGFSVAIPRFVAYEHGEGNYNKELIVFSTAVLWILFSSLMVALVLVVGGEKLAFLLFGSSAYVKFLFPIFLMITGTMFHSTVYSFFRGKLEMGKANMLQMLNMALIPVIAFFLGKSLRVVLVIMGGSWLLISFVISAYLFLNGVYQENFFENFKIIIRDLLIYGVQRIPGDFGLALLLSVPPIVMAHLLSPTEGGYTAFGISLLRMTGALFAPVGLIFLPLITQMLARKEFSRIIRYVLKLLWGTIFITLIGIVTYWLFTGIFLKLYLGSFSNQLFWSTRILVTAAFGYNIFIVLRSFVDAYYLKGINSLNIMISVAFLGIIVFIIRSYNLGFVKNLWLLSIPIYFLGILTVLTVFYTIRNLKTGKYGKKSSIVR